MTVQEILERKGRRVVTVPCDVSLLEVIRLLVRESIGCAVITEQGALNGILTERDVLRLAHEDPEGFALAKAATVMTNRVLVGHLDDPVNLVMEIMAHRRIRHLPVVDGECLVGIVSLGDVILALLDHIRAGTRDLLNYESVFLKGAHPSLLTRRSPPARLKFGLSRSRALGAAGSLTAGELLARKGREVWSVSLGTPMRSALRTMAEHDIGSLLVLDGGRRILGILTERDVLRAGSSDPCRLCDLEVREVMWPDVVACAPEDSLEVMMAIMTRNRFRHLPVVTQEGLEGIVSMRDLLTAMVQAYEAEHREVRNRIEGGTAPGL